MVRSKTKKEKEHMDRVANLGCLICRKEGIAPALYYRWSKDFIEAGKKRLNGDTERNANTGEVKDLKDESQNLKLVVAEQALEIRVLKKSLRGLE